jgi:hypothetical protein
MRFKHRQLGTNPLINQGLIMQLIKYLLEKPATLSTVSKYSVMNGYIYLALGCMFIFWPEAIQTIFRDRAFVGDEQSLFRILGLAVVVIGWLYVFGGRTDCRQVSAASVVDRLIFVPAVTFPLAYVGVFPHFLVTFAILDMSLALGAWVLLRKSNE